MESGNSKNLFDLATQTLFQPGISTRTFIPMTSMMALAFLSKHGAFSCMSDRIFGTKKRRAECPPQDIPVQGDAISSNSLKFIDVSHTKKGDILLGIEDHSGAVSRTAVLEGCAIAVCPCPVVALPAFMDHFEFQ